MVIEIKQTFSFFIPKLVLLNQESWEPWGPCVWTLQKRPPASRVIRPDPGTSAPASSELAVGRWPWLPEGDANQTRGRETLPPISRMPGQGRVTSQESEEGVSEQQKSRSLFQEVTQTTS